MCDVEIGGFGTVTKVAGMIHATEQIWLIVAKVAVSVYLVTD